MPSEEQKDRATPARSPAAEDYAALTATVRDLVDLMRQGGIGRLDIKRGDLRISLSAWEQPPLAPARAAPASNRIEADEPALAHQPRPDEYIVCSPMIGTFYAAPAPGERPYVMVGDAVEVGQTVAIIEAMKIMNEIVAERAGEVEEILVADGEAVEYGHPLMRIRVDV